MIYCYIFVDASLFGGRKLVAYASRQISPTERTYAQTEKEVLGITWACGKFSDCVLSGKFMIGKPLIPFHNMKIKLDALSCTAYCVPVKYLFTVILSLDRVHHTQIISQGLINSYCTTAGLLYQSPYRETQKSSVSHQGIQRSWAGVLKKVDMEHNGV